MKPSEMMVGKWYQREGMPGVWSPPGRAFCLQDDGWRLVTLGSGPNVELTREDTVRECCEHGRGLEETCRDGLCNRIVTAQGKFSDFQKAMKEAIPIDDSATFMGYSVVDYWRPIHLLLRDAGITTEEQLRARLAHVDADKRDLQTLQDERDAVLNERDQLRAEVERLKAENAQWRHDWTRDSLEPKTNPIFEDVEAALVPDLPDRIYCDGGLHLRGARHGQQQRFAKDNAGTSIADRDIKPPQRGAVVRCDNGWDE